MGPLILQSWVPGAAVGRYVLVHTLARGGMGEIWLARDGQGLVVLKRLLSGPNADDDAVRMFLDEARIAAQMDHPNVVRVFDLGQVAGSVYLAMEYLSGQTLSALSRRLIRRDGRVPEALAVGVIAAAARGLGFAHRKTDAAGRPLGIVHRDVSPQNLFITYDGKVKVLDFGIARAAGRLVRTAMGIIKGKLAYMSPEQAAGGALPVSSACDVYALGIVLFELVTGSRFHGSKEDLVILRWLAQESPAPRPSERGPVDAELEEIILRALAPRAEHRFADGTLFAEALEGWLKAHPPPPGVDSLSATMATVFEAERQAMEAALPALAPSPLLRTQPAPAQGSILTVPAKPSAPRFGLSNQPTILEAPNHAAKTLLQPPQVKASASPRSTPVVALAVGALLVAVAAGALAWSTLRDDAPAPPTRAGPVAAAPVPVLAAVVEVESVGDDVDAAAAAHPSAPEPPPPPPPLEAPPPEALPPLPAADRNVARPAGRLTFDTVPWTRVFLGTRLLGDTPLVELELGAGTHTLHLLNRGAQIDRRIEVTIEPDQTTVKRLSL